MVVRFHHMKVVIPEHTDPAIATAAGYLAGELMKRTGVTVPVTVCPSLTGCNVLARCLQFDLVKGCWIRDAEEKISASRV